MKRSEIKISQDNFFILFSVVWNEIWSAIDHSHRKKVIISGIFSSIAREDTLVGIKKKITIIFPWRKFFEKMLTKEDIQLKFFTKLRVFSLFYLILTGKVRA